LRLPSAFAEFHERIQLGGIPEGKISSAWSRLQSYLIAELAIPQLDIFVQGSYANKTAVKPPTSGREYDLDTVAIGFDADATADGALARLEEILAKDGDYKKRIERRAPCVRLRYAGDTEGRFHVDVVPAKHGSRPVIQVPRRKEGWHDSDPRSYTNWCVAQGAQFSRTVRMLKRWRDAQQSDRRKVKSIVLQVLIGQFYGGAAGDAETVVQVLAGIEGFLGDFPDTVPTVVNPVLPAEDLTARWPPEDYQDFRKEVIEAAALARDALAAQSERESHRLWRQLFGPDFPEAKQGGAEMPPTPPPGFERTPQVAPPRERYA
jgi:hypothetical protein